MKVILNDKEINYLKTRRITDIDDLSIKGIVRVMKMLNEFNDW